MYLKNIITIGTGKELYVNLAINLARSFLFWNANKNIKFILVTDQKHLIPPDIISSCEVVEVSLKQFGTGFSQKLWLNELCGHGQTIFIDSDCLIFGDLTHLFEIFKGNSVSVIGNYSSNGEWFGDTKSICKRFSLDKIPKFNGGLYYLEKSGRTDKIYEKARDLEKIYDEIGFVRLRGKPNDEVLMSLALEINQQPIVIDTGEIMSDPVSCPARYSCNVLTGKRLMYNPPLPSKLNCSWNKFTFQEPVIIHFLGEHIQDYQYKFNIFLLNHYQCYSKLKYLLILFAKIKFEYPKRVFIFTKNLFRPIYRAIFGTRKIKTSERL